MPLMNHLEAGFIRIYNRDGSLEALSIYNENYYPFNFNANDERTETMVRLTGQPLRLIEMAGFYAYSFDGNDWISTATENHIPTGDNPFTLVHGLEDAEESQLRQLLQ